MNYTINIHINEGQAPTATIGSISGAGAAPALGAVLDHAPAASPAPVARELTKQDIYEAIPGRNGYTSRTLEGIQKELEQFDSADVADLVESMTSDGDLRTKYRRADGVELYSRY